MPSGMKYYYTSKTLLDQRGISQVLNSQKKDLKVRRVKDPVKLHILPHVSESKTLCFTCYIDFCQSIHISVRLLYGSRTCTYTMTLCIHVFLLL